MRAAASFDGNNGRLQLLEKSYHFPARQPLAQDRPFCRVHAMQLKNVL